MKYTFDFNQLKQKKKLKRIYKDSVYRHINKYKGVTWSIIDEYNDITYHRHEHIELFLMRCNIKSALKDNDVLYLESMSKQKYILIPKKIRE